jgi:hypothetical protein
MAEYLTVEELAELPRNTVVTNVGGDLLSAAEMAAIGSWRVLRYGETSGDGPALGGEVRSAVGEILDVLGMLPVDGFADDLLGALGAIRSRVEQLDATVESVRTHVAGRVAALWPDRRTGGVTIPELVDMLAAEVRTLRARQGDGRVPERAGTAGTVPA